MSPAACAVFASTCLPEVTISSACSTPTIRGRRCVPPAPGQQTEMHFRQAALRGRDCDAIVAAQRDFETAAERRPMDRCDDGFGRVLDRILGVVEAGALRRFAELGDVGAGDEGFAFADQHDRLDGAVVDRLPASPSRCLRAPPATVHSQAVNSGSGLRYRLRRSDRSRR